MAILNLISNNPLIFHIAVIIASLIILVKAADLAVYGITRYARKLGLSDYLIGLIVVSLAASLPELVSALNGELMGDSGIVFGTILGSNIAGLSLVIGLLALVGKKVKVGCGILKKTKTDIFLLTILPFVLLIDSKLSRFDGALLITAYFIWLALLWKREGEFGKIKKDVKFKHLFRDGLIFVGCLIAILLLARWLVFSLINVASLLNISSYLIALVVIGIGSSIPDLTVGIRSVLRHHQDVGVGDVLGSLIMKSCLFLGIFALINPLVISWSLILVSFIFTILSVSLVLKFTCQETIDRKQGLILILLYVVFIIAQTRV